jgi:tetratricopeptide (TPR) repeat protein
MNTFEDLANEFLARVDGCHGMLARPNDTHYSLALVTHALQWLRAQLSQGKALTSAGEHFVASGAAYLGYLAYLSFEKRGFGIELSAQWAPGAEQGHLALFVSRHPDGGAAETYDQDFLSDMHSGILHPPRSFPVMKGKYFLLESLTLPSVEYLYMLGTHFMDSPFAGGNWPSGEGFGGTEEDFAVSRALLVDDLHTDLNLPNDVDQFAQLSNWVVWPPYGWDQNDGQRYNMMTLIDQIGVQRSVPMEHGVEYLYALLASQFLHLRNLAARTLLVLGQAPRDADETRLFLNAVNASDHAEATVPMVRFRWVLEGNDPATMPDAAFVSETSAYWQEMLQDAPRQPWTQLPILRDPVYQGLAERAGGGGIPEGEHREALDLLRQRYPGDWFVDVAYGYFLLQGPDPEGGETLLQEAIAACPGDPTAHFTLGAFYRQQGRTDEALHLYKEAARLQPWDPNAVANAMWMLTADMVA